MSEPATHKRPAGAPQRAVFLDRDGTLNVEKNYLFRCEEWDWIPGAVAAIARINALGFLAIVVTNQAGVARGMYGLAEVARLHCYVDAMLAAEGARIDGYYICPHHPAFGADCDCRKPQPGMLLRAAAEFGIALADSYMVGDKAVDAQAAANANVTPILVRTGHGEDVAGVVRVADVAAAVAYIAQRAA